MIPESARLEQSHLRLRRLYEISKLLTRFEGIEKTLPEVVGMAARALPVRSAVLLLAEEGTVRTYVWKTEDRSVREMASALAHARATHAYLAGWAPMLPSSVDEAPTSVHGLPRVVHDASVAPASEERRFIVLPLVVERSRIFGALQFEGASVLDETDLGFVNAVANQVAVAIDRQAKSDEARRVVEEARAAAEDAGERSRAQLELTRALTGSLDVELTFTALVRCAVPAFADICFIDELTTTRHLVRVATGLADPVREAAASALQLAAAPPTERFRPPSTRVPALIEDLWGSDSEKEVDLHSARDRSFLRQLGATSVIVVPLTAHGRNLGVATFAYAESGRRYGAGDLFFAQEIAHRTAMAVDSSRLRETAERAARHRQDIIAVVSHDLRTPLNTVLLAAGVLIAKSRLGGAPEDLKKLEMIRSAAHDMTRLANDLLDMSSIEAGRLSVDRAPTDVGKLFGEVMEAKATAISAAALQFELSVESGLIASCDRGRILQVLNNLLSNAIKFTPAGGAISISAERHAHEVYCEITDTGRGISKELLPHLFERYFQARSTASLGRGLGLFITKGIIEAHGGVVGVRSEQDRGSSFFFTLPDPPPAEVLTSHLFP